MLVLARRLNERVVIPCVQASIQVVGLQGGIVRLGIDAPADVKVFREEVLRKDLASVADAEEAPADPGVVHRRLSATAQELSALRRELRDKLPSGAAAALFRIDRELTDLARKMETTSREVCTR